MPAPAADSVDGTSANKPASSGALFPPGCGRSGGDLLAALLADQKILDTPVARFSDHENPPALEPVYRDLIPLSAPKPGEQYAFEVDLDACSGCKACVAACHNLNGLDETETWRDVGVLKSLDSAQPFLQTITSACHHCVEPACLDGCPVLAYDKDPLTGIVRHLDDQCIGCSYCVLKCPYDVPKYNERLGIVRKCDMCHDRLAANEAPACVQACPTQAIRITVVTRDETVRRAREGTFLPGAPDPEYTKPTTRYRTARPLPVNVEAGDAAALRLQPAHWPLVLMLVLTQLGSGLWASGVLRADTVATVIGFGLLTAGLAASILHLGQPLRAWRVFLGLRSSWLSREAVCFALFWLSGLIGTEAVVRGHPVPWPLFAFSLALGAAGIISSIMIYASTRRRFWRLAAGANRMAGSALIPAASLFSPPLGAVCIAVKLLGEAAALCGNGVSARLQRERLPGAVRIRITFGLAACACFAAGFFWSGLGLFAGGEIAERYLFFRAVDAPKMPGIN